MFTTSHFIWIGISIFLIVIVSLLLIRYKCPSKKLLTVCLGFSVLCEIVKTLSNMVETDLYTNMSVPVKILPVSSLPLQLCSLQIFFFFYLFFGKNEKLKADLNCFMCMCMLVGAPFAILLPNSSTSFTNPVAYQFFLYHAMIIIYAIYQIKTHQVTYTMRNLKINLGLLGVLTICSIWINSIFAATGHPTNFFYTMCPPADHLPYLNMNQCWEMYLLKLVLLGLVLSLIYHAPFLLKKKKATSNILVKSASER